MDETGVKVSEERMYSVVDFIKIMGISRSGAYQGISSGVIPHVRLGKRILISGAYIKALLAVVE